MEKFGMDSTFIQDDTTHKMNVEGLPILAVGTSDIQQVFHPVALAVVSHEDEVINEDHAA